MAIVTEDGVEIGPTNSRHADIVNLGSGRYSHWRALENNVGRAGLYFSATGNSAPRTNGREYRIICLQH